MGGRPLITDMADKSSWEQLLRPLRHGLNAELAALLLRMQADDEVQARYEDLAERNSEGQLSPAERDAPAGVRDAAASGRPRQSSP